MGALRFITDGEIEILESVFGEAIDTARVRIRDGGAMGADGFTPFGIINIDRDFY